MANLSTRSWQMWSLLGLILVAAALRLWSLDSLPPGLFYDEAFNGVDARAILSGENRPIYFTGNNGREPLYIYLQALLVALIGPQAYALRLTSALIGILTVPLTYLAAATLLAPNRDEAQRKRAVSPLWLGLFAAAGIAISYWHLHLSRLGFRAVLLPPISALALLYFWRAWSGQRLRDYGWAGFWFALALYTYTAARLMPLTVICFVVVEFTISLAVRRRDPILFREVWLARLRGLLWTALIGLIIAAPLAYAILQDPVILSARTADVSILVKGTEDMPETPAGRLLFNTVNMARSFYDRGDLNLRHNIPGHPVHDGFMAVLFTLGLLAALWRIRAPNMRLLLIWMAVMALPAVLSIEAPHALRAVGMLLPVALLYALGAGAVMSLLTRWFAPAFAGPLLLALIVVIGGAFTARDYFGRWASEPLLGEFFSLDLQLAAAAAADIRREDSAAALVATRRLYLTPHMRFAIGKLPRQDRPAGESFDVSGDVHFLAEQYADPRQSAFLIWEDGSGEGATWLQPLQTGAGEPLIYHADDADGHDLLRSPLHQEGWPQVHQGKLAELAFEARSIRYPLDVQFANGLHLVGYDLIPEQVTPGEEGVNFMLTTMWRHNPDYPRPDENTFDQFAHLSFANGQSQQNSAIGDGYALVFWQPGEIVEDRRLLFVPSDAAAGKAHFETGLYDPSASEQGERIGILDASGNVAADQVTFGVVALGIEPPQAEVGALESTNALFDGRIELIGWRAERLADDPTRLAVDLAWRALDRSMTDYTAFVHLLDADGQIVGQQDQPPAGLDNPTTRWLPDEIVRSTFELEIPTDSPLNDFHVRVGLYEPVSSRQLPISAASNSIADLSETFVVLPLGPR